MNLTDCIQSSYIFVSNYCFVLSFLTSLASLYARFAPQFQAVHFVLVQVLVDLSFRSRSMLLSR